MNSFKKNALRITANMSFGLILEIPTCSPLPAPQLKIFSATVYFTSGATATTVIS